MQPPIFSEISPPARILLGPGPSMVSPRVMRALSAPVIGHLDPEFLKIMDGEQQLLRRMFQTENRLTFAIPGTGSAGMEAAICNLIEAGDPALVCVMGYFGERLCEMVLRYGGQLTRMDRAWGETFDPQAVTAELQKRAYKLIALVHAETSTGALQPGIPEIAAAAHASGALLVLDTVTSLGGLPVEIDRWGVDIAYSGSQKSLSCPPGLAPITVSDRALQVIKARKAPVANWYLDLTSLEKYWDQPHAYHHTAPCSLHFALCEGLRMAVEEGLEARFARHRANAELLWAGLEALDLPPFVPLDHRLSTLTTPCIPAGVDDMNVRSRLLQDFNIEIAGGFGPLKGKVWRVGLMGYSSRRENVTLLLAALETILR